MYVLIRTTQKGTQRLMADRFEYIGDAYFAAQTRTRKSKNKYVYQVAKIM